MAFDSGIAKIGIFCFILLTAFIGLISLIPSGFQTERIELSERDIPDVWMGINLFNYSFTDYETFNLTNAGHEGFVIGGRDLDIYWLWNNGIGDYLNLEWDKGMWNNEDFVWYNKSGDRVSYQDPYEFIETIDADILNETYNSYGYMEFNCKCNDFNVTALVSFNENLYDTPIEAWDNDNLQVLIGITAEDSNYSMDVWTVLEKLLRFDTLTLFGTNSAWAIVLNGIFVSMIVGGIVVFAGAVLFELLPF